MWTRKFLYIIIFKIVTSKPMIPKMNPATAIGWQDNDTIDSYNIRLKGFKDGKADMYDDNNTHHQ